MELAIILALGALILAATRSGSEPRARGGLRGGEAARLPPQPSAVSPQPSAPSRRPPPPGPGLRADSRPLTASCDAWTARATELAVKPDGSRVTDGEMQQLEDAPLWLIPAEYEQAVTAWARRAGRPPAGCSSTIARRWHAWVAKAGLQIP